MSVRNLDYLRTLTTSEMPGFGTKLYETLSDLIQQQSNIQQQANTNANGQPTTPPAIDKLNVTGQNGHFNIQVTHAAELYRGVQYHVEYDTDPHFTNPHPVDMGSSRDHNVFLGNGTYYWRASSSYGISATNPQWAYHGSATNPTAVSGGGDIGGPALQDSQGSGTGIPRQGLQGPGSNPFRSITGAPPVR